MLLPETLEGKLKVNQEPTVVIAEDFDEALWKKGVDGGAFSGLKDPDARWFTLEADGAKVALASAVPGPGDLTSVSYFVMNEERGKGYATKLASALCDRFEKASFLVMKSNEPSVKVALAALRERFSVTAGHNVLRLTKAASDGKGSQKNTVGTTLEGKIHESFTVAADKIYQAGLLTTKERIALSNVIGDVLGRFRRQIEDRVHAMPMTDRAHELLGKSAATRAEYAAVARLPGQLAKLVGPYARRKRIDATAQALANHPRYMAGAARSVRPLMKDPGVRDEARSLLVELRESLKRQGLEQKRLFMSEP